MNRKSWLKYFILISLILFVVFFGDYLYNHYKELGLRSFKFNLYLLYTIDIVIDIIIGFLLGLNQLIHEIKKIGTWRLNIPKLTLFGIPAFYFSFGTLLYFSIGRFFPKELFYPVITLINSNNYFFHIFQLILGYTIVTSFYKKPKTV